MLGIWSSYGGQPSHCGSRGGGAVISNGPGLPYRTQLDNILFRTTLVVKLDILGGSGVIFNGPGLTYIYNEGTNMIYFLYASLDYVFVL